MRSTQAFMLSFNKPFWIIKKQSISRSFHVDTRAIIYDAFSCQLDDFAIIINSKATATTMRAPRTKGIFH